MHTEQNTRGAGVVPRDVIDVAVEAALSAGAELTGPSPAAGPTTGCWASRRRRDEG